MYSELFSYQQSISANYHAHDHQIHELHYITHGQANYRYGDLLLKVKAGDFFITRPKVEHVILTPPGGFASQYLALVHLEGAAEERLFSALEEKGFMAGVSHIGLSHLTTFENAMYWHRRSEQVFKDRAMNQILAFLYNGLGSRSLNDEHPSYLSKCLRLIQQSSRESIYLEHIAEQCGVSPAHLSRSFKKAFGVPPLKYHTMLRMQLAMEMLIQKPEKLSIIAQDLGYANEFHFSKVFYQTMGMRPSSVKVGVLK